MVNVTNKAVEKIKIHILYSVIFFPKIVPFMTISKNVVEPERPQMAI